MEPSSSNEFKEWLRKNEGSSAEYIIHPIRIPEESSWQARKQTIQDLKEKVEVDLQTETLLWKLPKPVMDLVEKGFMKPHLPKPLAKNTFVQYLNNIIQQSPELPKSVIKEWNQIKITHEDQRRLEKKNKEIWKNWSPKSRTGWGEWELIEPLDTMIPHIPDSADIIRIIKLIPNIGIPLPWPENINNLSIK